MKEAIECLGSSGKQECIIRILQVCDGLVMRKNRRQNLKKRAKVRIEILKKDRKDNDKR